MTTLAIVARAVVEGREVYWRTIKGTTGQELLRAWKTISKEAPPHSRFYTVNCSTPAIPPPFFDPYAQPELWCPFCGDLRPFVHCEQREVTHCVICHVSTEQYIVQDMNDLDGRLNRMSVKKLQGKKGG